MPPSPNGSNEIWDPQSRSLWSNTSYEGHGTQRSVTETEWNDCFWAMRSYINMCIYIYNIYRVALSVFSEFLEIKINIIIICIFSQLRCSCVVRTTEAQQERMVRRRREVHAAWSPRYPLDVLKDLLCIAVQMFPQ